LESKPSDLDETGQAEIALPNLKIWTPTRLNLMALILNFYRDFITTPKPLSVRKPGL